MVTWILNVTGNQVATGIELCYRDGIDEEQYVQLTAPEGVLKKQSITWIIALQTVSHWILALLRLTHNCQNFPNSTENIDSETPSPYPN